MDDNQPYHVSFYIPLGVYRAFKRICDGKDYQYKQVFQAILEEFNKKGFEIIPEFKPVLATKHSWLKNLSKEERTEIARSGGVVTSQNREFMAEIGKKGGTKTSQDREHMREIGSLGGIAARERKI